MEYSKLIKEIRNELLLTQEELANELGVTSVTISRWELGLSIPSIKAKRKIKELMIKNNLDVEKLRIN